MSVLSSLVLNCPGWLHHLTHISYTPACVKFREFQPCPSLMRITYKNNEALPLSSCTWNTMKNFLKHKYLSPQNYCGNPYENSNRPRLKEAYIYRKVTRLLYDFLLTKMLTILQASHISHMKY